MNGNDAIRLQHMLDAALECLEFSEGATRETLDADKKLAKALTLNIAIIGEAASRITKATQVTYPHIPWPSIISMRNIIIHEYFDIDLDEVWSTVEKDLPELIPLLEQLLKNNHSEE